jgi:hypothetical protein
MPVQLGTPAADMSTLSPRIAVLVAATAIGLGSQRA